MDSSTVGTWVEDVYVGGDFIGELDFTVTAPASCSYGDSGAGYMYSTDIYLYGLYAIGVSPRGSTTVYHDIYSGPCSFTGGSGGGEWITASYVTSGPTEVIWTVADGGNPSNDSGGCPRCYLYDDYDYYPVIDYATLSSNVYNSEANTVQVLSTTVTLWIDWSD